MGPRMIFSQSSLQSYTELQPSARYYALCQTRGLRGDFSKGEICERQNVFYGNNIFCSLKLLGGLLRRCPVASFTTYLFFTLNIHRDSLTYHMTQYRHLRSTLSINVLCIHTLCVPNLQM